MKFKTANNTSVDLNSIKIKFYGEDDVELQYNFESETIKKVMPLILKAPKLELKNSELTQELEDGQFELDSKDSEIENLQANIESLQKIAHELIAQVQSLGEQVEKLSPCVFTRNAAKDLLFELPNIENQIDDIYSSRY